MSDDTSCTVAKAAFAVIGGPDIAFSSSWKGDENKGGQAVQNDGTTNEQGGDLRPANSLILPSSATTTSATLSAKFKSPCVTHNISSLSTAEQWYEYYAVRYPSREFLKQRQLKLEEERQQSLQHEREKQKQPRGGWLRRFFFGSGSSSPSEAADPAQAKTYPGKNEVIEDASDGAGEDAGANGAANNMGRNGRDSEPDGWSNAFWRKDQVEDGLCNTTSLIDHYAIPHEAMSFHRFHMASERRSISAKSPLITPADQSVNESTSCQDDTAWKVVLPVRQCVGWDILEDEMYRKAPHFCVVGFGLIAEYPFSPEMNPTQHRIDGDNSTHNSAQISLTSDWEVLLAGNTSLSERKNAGDVPPSDVRHARAASVGPDCLMISWGRGDGWIVFYRRISQRKEQHKIGDQVFEIGWEAIAAASPSEAVLNVTSINRTPSPYFPDDNIPEPTDQGRQTMTRQQQQQHQMRLERLYEAGSLNVTDLIPFIVSNDASTQQSLPVNSPILPPSAVLAISRLAGYVELLPLPNWAWLPNSLETSRPTESTAYSSRRYLPNITSLSKITAFATTQHHMDVTALDVYRTRVGVNSIWDSKRHPDGPPAEIILAACGCSSMNLLQSNDKEGYEIDQPWHQQFDDPKTTVTLWGVTTVHAYPQPPKESIETQRQQEHQNVSPNFDLHIQYLGSLGLNNVGADASVFVSVDTVNHWARPQQKDRLSVLEKKEDEKNRQNARSPISSVTATAPLVSLRFTPKLTYQPSMSFQPVQSDRVLIAALDYNGGVTIIDCTRAVRLAEHMDIQDYRGIIIGDDFAALQSFPSNPNISILFDRETMATSLSPEDNSIMYAHAHQVEWWRPSSPFAACDHQQSLNCETIKQSLVDPSSLGIFSLATTAAIMKAQDNVLSMTSVIRLQQWNLVATDVENNAINPFEVFNIPLSSCAGSMDFDDKRSTVLLLPMQYQDLNETLPYLQLISMPGGYHPSSSLELSLFGVRKFSKPTDIIGILLRRSEPTKALEVAQRFGGAEHFGGNVMDECRIRLWEDQRNLSALSDITNDEYVVGEALALDQISGHDYSFTDGLHLEDLLEIYREASLRCDRLRTKESDTDTLCLTPSVFRLRNGVRRLGTFQLLFRHFMSIGAMNEQTKPEELAWRFLYGFRNASVYDLASSVAARGDIDALTLLLARHPVSTRARMDILDCIPLDLDIFVYEQLLPCHSRTDVEDGQFLLRGRDQNQLQFLNSMQIFASLSEIQLKRAYLTTKNKPTFNVFIDDADRIHVTQHYWECSDYSCDEHTASRDEVSLWYLKRAISLHNLTGQISSLKQFTEMGLIRLGVTSLEEVRSHKLPEINQEGDAVRKLLYLHSASDLLGRVLMDKFKEYIPSFRQLPTDLWTDGRELFTSVLHFCSMDIPDAIPFILDNRYRTQQNLIPFVSGDGYIDPTEGSTFTISIDSERLAQKVEPEIMKLCLDKVRMLREPKSLKRKKLSAEPNTSNPLSVKLQDALSLCSLCITYDAHDIQRHKCIIQSNLGIVAFVHEIFCSVVTTVGKEWEIITSDILSQLWSMFESLPTVLSNTPVSVKCNIGVVMSHLNFRLVALQLFCKWRGRKAMPRGLWEFLTVNPTMKSNDPNGFYDLVADYDGIGIYRDFYVAAYDVISTMSQSFCELVVRRSPAESSETIPDGSYESLLFDFISDVEELDQRFLRSSIKSFGFMKALLFTPLLSQQSFEVLSNFLKIRPDWFCSDSIRSELLSYVRDVLSQCQFSSTDDRTRAGLMCQDTLGTLFLDLGHEFESCRRFLDAKRFANEILKLKPTIFDQLFMVDYFAAPVRLIQVLMMKSPCSLLLGCEFWKDDNCAFNASIDASVYFSSQIKTSLSGGSSNESSHILPPMPGVLVMQLANILGIHKPYDLLLVKRYMIDGAMQLNLAPAAAAICYSMLCDAAFSMHKDLDFDKAGWNEKHELQILNCITMIVTEKSYKNISLKKDLCTLSLRLLPTTNTLYYNTLLESISSLEYEMLNATKENVSPRVQSADKEISERDCEVSDFLVFKAAGMVARQAKGIVGRSALAQSSSIQRCDDVRDTNPFVDCNIAHVFHNTKYTSPIDLLPLISRLGSIDRKITTDSTEEEPFLSARDTLEMLSRELLERSILEALKPRRTPIHRPLASAFILEVVGLGLACLHHISRKDVALQIIERVLETVIRSISFDGNETGNNLSQIQPDIAIVRRLNERGYSLNAARRATIMTNNQSYSAALSWAVSHFHDADFDSPMIFLHNEDTVQVDRELVLTARKLMRILEGLRTDVLRSLRLDGGERYTSPTVSEEKNNSSSSDVAIVFGGAQKKPTNNTFANGPTALDPVTNGPPTLARSIERAFNFDDKMSDLHHHNGHPLSVSYHVPASSEDGVPYSSDPDNPKRPREEDRHSRVLPALSGRQAANISQPVCDRVYKTPKTKNLVGRPPPPRTCAGAMDGNLNRVAPPPFRKEERKNETSTSPSPSSQDCNHVDKYASPTSKVSASQTPPTGEIDRVRPPYSGGSVSSIDCSLSSRSSVRRQIQRGKVLGTQKLSSEERMRLASEGRRLLEAAKVRNKCVSAPPSSILTSERVVSSPKIKR